MSLDKQVTTSSITDLNTEIEEPFSVELINHIQERFVDKVLVQVKHENNSLLL